MSRGLGDVYKRQLVVIAGEIMRMPGLPKEPQALHIDIVNGEIEGLS